MLTRHEHGRKHVYTHMQAHVDMPSTWPHRCLHSHAGTCYTPSRSCLGVVGGAVCAHARCCSACVHAHVRVCVRACACVCACARACVCAYVRACVRTCVCACVRAVWVASLSPSSACVRVRVYFALKSRTRERAAAIDETRRWVCLSTQPRESSLAPLPLQQQPGCECISLDRAPLAGA